MRPWVDLTGERFGRLTVIRRDKRALWYCVCDCGTSILCSRYNLNSGSIKSCGCYRREQTALRSRSHGFSGTKIYKTWRGMMARCYNANRANYKYYGGRGIVVCQSWHKFENFFEDMGEVPAGKSLDRFPDNDGNYEPNNCRWATSEQQSNNRRPKKPRKPQF